MKTKNPTRHEYYAVIDGEHDTYGVVIPDFPGCHGGGTTIEAALDDAKSALSVIVKMMVADGEALPEPTDLDAIDKAREANGELRGIRSSITLAI